MAGCISAGLREGTGLNAATGTDTIEPPLDSLLEKLARMVEDEAKVVEPNDTAR